MIWPRALTSRHLLAVLMATALCGVTCQLQAAGCEQPQPPLTPQNADFDWSDGGGGCSSQSVSCPAGENLTFQVDYFPEGLIPPCSYYLHHWNFGDGSMSTTEVPTAQHRYVQPGVYQVVLTIDNLPNHPPAVLQHTIVVTQAAPALSAPVLFLLGLALIGVGLFANR